tara:strand:- start:16456 stop:17379 length:924 start_codon:yes stop_codon:yes gene_type:complete
MTYPTGTVAMSGSAILFITGSTLTEGSNTGSDAFDDKAIVAKWEVDPSDNTSVQLRIPKEITGQKQDRIAFYMSGSGRVGIGTKDPQAAFDVRDTSEKDNVEPEEYDSDAAETKESLFKIDRTTGFAEVTASIISSSGAMIGDGLYRSHHYFKGFCLGISSGNWQFGEDMADPQYPLQLNQDYGNTSIDAGSLSDVSSWFRSSCVVVPRDCKATKMVGWATSTTTGNINIALVKITPTRNTTAAVQPYVICSSSFAALNNHDKMEDFTETTMVTSSLAAGDILMPFVISPDTKYTYFNFTLETTSDS